MTVEEPKRPSRSLFQGVRGLIGLTALLCLCSSAVAQSSPRLLFGWGGGPAGDGTSVNRVRPVLVMHPNGRQPLTGVVSVCAGAFHSAVLRSDGSILTWGEVGWPDYSRALPAIVQLGLPSQAVAICAGSRFTAALLADGQVFVWGENPNVGATTGRVTQVIGLNNVRALSAGHSFVLAQMPDMAVQAWGHNLYGELGDGTLIDRQSPAPVVDLAEVASLSGGIGSSFAVLSDGSVCGWGEGDYGQLGNGSTANQRLPVRVLTPDHIESVSGGNHHTLAVRQDGTVWAWGDNTFGQLGDGSTQRRLLPAMVPGLAHIKQVEACADFSFAVSKSGRLLAWGDNSFGSLGVGDALLHRTPTEVAPPLPGYRFRVVAGNDSGRRVLAIVECAADFNHSEDVTLQDIFDYLGAYFANDESADFDGDDVINVQDIFGYLSAWMAGC